MRKWNEPESEKSPSVKSVEQNSATGAHMLVYSRFSAFRDSWWIPTGQLQNLSLQFLPKNQRTIDDHNGYVISNSLAQYAFVEQSIYEVQFSNSFDYPDRLRGVRAEFSPEMRLIGADLVMENFEKENYDWEKDLCLLEL